MKREPMDYHDLCLRLGIKLSASQRAAIEVLEASGLRMFVDFGYATAEAKALALSDEQLQRIFGASR